MIVHEEYDPSSNSQYNDIALLRLGKKATYSKFIKPICLPVHPTLRNKDHAGMSLQVSGWGSTQK